MSRKKVILFAILGIVGLVLLQSAYSYYHAKKQRELEREAEERIKYPESPVVNIKAETAVSGELSNYIQVVDNQYKLEFKQEYNYYEPVIQLKLKFIKSKKMTDDKRITLRASILDQNGIPSNEIKLSSDDNRVVSLINQGGNKEEWISFKGSNLYFQKKDSLQIIAFFEKVKKSAKISVSSEIRTQKKQVEQTPTISDNETNTEMSASQSGTENWNEVLVKYEKFTDDYITYLKKIVAIQKKQKHGDTSGLTELSELMPKAMELNKEAIELGEKLQNARNNLSPSQSAKFLKLQLKFTKAAMEMSAQQ